MSNYENHQLNYTKRGQELESKKRAFLTLIILSCVAFAGWQFYKNYISPLKGRPTCKYYPTCSQYAIEAIRVHGVFKGFYLAFFRILRCNPFCKGGYDPVPPKKEKI